MRFAASIEYEASFLKDPQVKRVQPEALMGYLVASTHRRAETTIHWTDASLVSQILL